MKHEILSPIGAVVRDLTVGAVSADVTAELANLLAGNGVVVLPDQDTDDPAFLAFLQSFGGLTFSTGETPVDGFPDLNVISNVGRTTPPRSVFHVDTSYVRRPPAYTALRAVQVPAQGGETLFTNQYRAFDTLSGELRDELAGRTIRHAVTGLQLGAEDESEAEHPLFRTHPVSGRTALYLSTPERCTAISGLPEQRSRELIDTLYDHSTAKENTYRHSWSPGDVVMWDNGCVMHRADHARVRGDRVMHRGMVAGYLGSLTRTPAA